MPIIHELDSHMADLIAAGEVVERPASVCKELIENSIDAGASQITVEIENGGISYLRICDNGCGMEPQDAPAAFRRHATSKIRTKDDLAAICTLGFRGEALAAISAVSKVDLFTKQKDRLEGTHIFIEGGKIKANESAGCPDGTTFVIKDLFYNTPARMKFLKKDFTEAGYILSVIEHAAESHPEIAFRYIRDGKTAFHSPGTGQLEQAVFAVFGKEMSRNLIPIPQMEYEDVKVWGFASKPHSPRANRTYQHFFVNGRFIKSKIIQAAMEEAYKNSIITGKFPYGCICIELPLSQVDVNVHPAKTEVKFAFEKKIFSAVYSACKNALAGDENAPEILADDVIKHRLDSISNTKSVSASKPLVSSEYRQSINAHTSAGSMYSDSTYKGSEAVSRRKEPVKRQFKPFVEVDDDEEQTAFENTERPKIFHTVTKDDVQDDEQKNICAENTQSEKNNENIEQSEEILAQARPTARVKGSCFDTYIIAEDEKSMILIDKHAAHERMIFNKLQKTAQIPTQILLEPAIAELSGEEYAVVIENLELLLNIGFQIEDFGGRSVAVREAPAYIDAGDIPVTISEIAQKLMDNRTPVPDKRDDLIHMVSCKAAIKGGWDTSIEELQKICDEVMSDPDIICCPHGRPVMVRLTKYELDKLFKRVNQ